MWLILLCLFFIKYLINLNICKSHPPFTQKFTHSFPFLPVSNRQNQTVSIPPGSLSAFWFFIFTSWSTFSYARRVARSHIGVFSLTPGKNGWDRYQYLFFFVSFSSFCSYCYFVVLLYLFAFVTISNLTMMLLLVARDIKTFSSHWCGMEITVRVIIFIWKVLFLFE